MLDFGEPIITGSTYYILDKDKNVVPTNDLRAWSEFFEKPDRFLFRTKLKEVDVSTVFIGLDHRFGLKEGDPIVFETLVMGGEHDGYMERYCTYKQAEESHHRIVKALMKGEYPERKTLTLNLKTDTDEEICNG